MEIVKKKLVAVFIFCFFGCKGQIVDTIKILCDLDKFKKDASKRLELQYTFTQKNYNEIKKIYKSSKDTLLILTDFPLSSFEIHSIPFFKVKKGGSIEAKKNFANLIDFSSNAIDQSYTIYLKQRLYADFRYSNNDTSAIFNVFFESLIASNYNKPILIGGGQNYLYFLKLNLEVNYFTFFIEGLQQDALFIIDKGLIFAIINPTNEGKFEKIELNKYFANYIGQEKLNDIARHGHATFKKKYKICKTKFFNKKYFIKVKN